MEKFKFRLEKLLKYQQSLLMMMEIGLASKNRQYSEIEETLKEYQRIKLETFFVYHIAGGSGIDDLRQAELYRESLKQKIEMVHRNLLLIEKQKEQLQKDYTLQHSRCRALELLKQKELSQYKSKMIRYTEGIIDDVWLARRGRFGSF